jgi:hypothetical protein
VPVRDGVRLLVNVFRANQLEQAPVTMSVTPYGKNKMPDWLGMTFMRLAGVRFGRLDCSTWTGFESPDPVFWTAAGYVVVQADVRGMHRSEGHAGVLKKWLCRDVHVRNRHAGESVQTRALSAVRQQERHCHGLHT